MSDTCTSVAHPAAKLGILAHPSSHFLTMANFRARISAWHEQAHFRWELKQMALGNPHLIDDIGLTREQADAEISKLPFWQR